MGYVHWDQDFRLSLHILHVLPLDRHLTQNTLPLLEGKFVLGILI